MKWTTKELRKEYKTKVGSLSNYLELVNRYDVATDERADLLSNIAVVLRALFCKDRTGIPLIESSGYANTMIFPLRNTLEPYNILKESLLVGFFIEGKKCSFMCGDYPFSATKVPSAYLTFNNWLNEVVIDFKREGYPPITREQVIKLIADRRGAHFDVKIDPYTTLLKTEGIASMGGIVIDGIECSAGCVNLLSETVMSIAQETIFAYNYLREPVISARGDTKFILNFFDYSDSGNKKFKFSVCSPAIHAYNTNDTYKCNISQYPLHGYSLLFRSRFFDVYIVNIDL